MIYLENEVKEATLSYFDGDDLATDVWMKKYALRDKDDNLLEKTPEDMHHRLAKEFARIEKNYPNPLSEEEIFELLKGFKRIVPQGSPMAGIGNDYQNVSLSNCVVVDGPEDDMSSIFDVGKNLANLYKRRCGVGLDISKLRPEGASVKNSSKTSSGAWSFADFYSYITRMIGQSGRRGACMITMDIRSIDSPKFAVMKNDLTKVTGANVSLKISDDFMIAVQNDDIWEMRFPVEGTPIITQEIRARELWDVVVKSATLTAEPGILMWDNITKMLPANCYEFFKTVSTNPCQPGFASVLTPGGIVSFDDIDEGSTIWSSGGWTKILKKWSTGNKPVYEYNTSSGRFIGTSNHRIIYKNEKVEIGGSTGIDVLAGPINQNIICDPTDIMDGLVIGDGTRYPSSKNKVYLTIGEDDKDYHNSEISQLIIEKHAVRYENAWKIQTSITEEELPLLPERLIPARFYFGGPNKVAGFLRGLYSANGCVLRNYNRITLKTTSLELLKQVQTMLSSLGIRSYYTTNTPSGIEWKNGFYISRQSYDLNISTDRQLFKEKIGFIQNYKNVFLNEVCDTNIKNGLKSSPIRDINYLGDYEVFDITVDNGSHTYWTGGVNVSNCSELPLSKFDSCRLLSINLKNFVLNKFEKDARFDGDLFQKTVRLATRLSDDIVDLELEKIENILALCNSEDERQLWEKLCDSARRGRRIGLGAHGLADALACMNMPYDSQAALDVVEDIFRILKIVAYDESINLASERGAFPEFDWEIEKNCEFFKLFPSELIFKMKQFGRRNISLLTIAPTGSVSILSRVSSGMEPVFRNSYKRRRKVENNSENLDFTDKLGDKWQEYNVFHKNVKDYLDQFQTDIIPDFFTTSDQIDPFRRIEIQEAMQKHIDHSISSTINLPKGTTPELVGELYMSAWAHGLKGVTVYVDGSRDGVLLPSDTPDKSSVATGTFANVDAFKRLETLPCDVHNVTIKDEKWTIFVGLMDGKPYEVFGGMSDKIELPGEFSSGFITKRSRKTQHSIYDLKLNGIVIKDLIKTFDNHEYGTLTRLISLSLRHGAHIEYVCSQLQKDKNSNIFSFHKVLARVLKRYVEDGRRATSDKTCEACGAPDSIVYQEGCLICTSCGWSRC